MNYFDTPAENVRGEILKIWIHSQLQSNMFDGHADGSVSHYSIRKFLDEASEIIAIAIVRGELP